MKPIATMTRIATIATIMEEEESLSAIKKGGRCMAMMTGRLLASVRCEVDKRMILKRPRDSYVSRFPCYAPCMLTAGDTAPAFAAKDQHGNVHTLDQYKGQWVLLYFYPKDDTQGCTAEACTMRDNIVKMKDWKVTVIGVSTDDVESHKKFADKYELSFTLLADTEKEIVNAYGVWAEKSIYGKTYMGTLRNSFLIDPEGKITKVYEDVKPEKHAKDVLRDMAAMDNEGMK